MKLIRGVAIAVASVTLGIAIGYAASKGPTLIELNAGKPAKEAGLAMLAEAERLAGTGTWELIAVGRIYYLSGDKERAQLLFDKATSGKPDAGNWQRVAAVWEEIGDKAKAEECYQKALVLMGPKDDTGQADVGAWFIRSGRRAKGEELLTRAMQRSPNEIWHYVRASEALLGLPPGR